MGENLPLIIAIFICIILSGYFSATETSFSSLNKIKLKNLANKGNKKAEKTLLIAEKYDKLISTILIGNNIVNILSASLATILFCNLLGDNLGPTISTIVLTIIVLIFGEITPKTLAKQFPEKFAMFSTSIISLFMKILFPLVVLFSLLNKLLNKFFKSEDEGITEEELLTIVEEAEEDGNIDIEDKILIENVIEFNDICVGDIYTPRVDIEGVNIEDSRENIFIKFKETAYSRLPVYKENIDNIVGILNYKDFYNKEDSIENLIKPTLFVTKNKKINELLKELQKQKIHMAVVINEFGETVGILSLEDILEEIVGDIWDEHDEIEETILEKNENEYIIHGNASIMKLPDKIDIESSHVQTVGGFVLELFGKIPSVGEIFENEKLKIEILSMNNKRINKINLKIKEKED